MLSMNKQYIFLFLFLVFRPGYPHSTIHVYRSGHCFVNQQREAIPKPQDVTETRKETKTEIEKWRDAGMDGKFRRNEQLNCR